MCTVQLLDQILYVKYHTVIPFSKVILLEIITYMIHETGIPGIYSFLSKQLTIGENLIFYCVMSEKNNKVLNIYSQF